MTKYIKILVLFLTLSACGQNATEMKTPENANEKFAEFIAKKKFVEENFYPGIADEKMRPIFGKKSENFIYEVTPPNPFFWEKI